MSHTSWEAGEVAQEVLPASTEEVVSWCQFWGRRDDQLDGWMYQDMNSYGYCLYGCGICSIWKSIPWVLMSICNDASQGMLLNAFDLLTSLSMLFIGTGTIVASVIQSAEPTNIGFPRRCFKRSWMVPTRLTGSG